MSKVFISYKQEERERMRPIADGLRALNIDVWFDEKLEPDRSFTEEIEGLVKEAAAQLVCWSPEAVKSEWVRGEAEKGRQRGVLIAVLIDYCELPAPFNMHHAEDLVGWSGNVKHAGWRKVVDAVGRKLERPGLGELSALQMSDDPEAWKRWAQKYATDPFCETAWAKAEELEIAGARARMAQQRAAAQKAAEEQAEREADDKHRAAIEAHRIAAERAADEARRASIEAQRLSAERLRQQQANAAPRAYAPPPYAPPSRYDTPVYDDDPVEKPPSTAPKLLVPLAVVVVLGIAGYFGSQMLNAPHAPPAATQVTSQEAGSLTVASATASHPRLQAPRTQEPDPSDNLAGAADTAATNDVPTTDIEPTPPDQIMPMQTPASFGGAPAGSPTGGVARVTWAQIPSTDVLNHAYPVGARAAHMEGRAVLNCGVRSDFGVDCTVMSESPAGYGFGNAAVQAAAAALRANPTLTDGAPSPGGRAQVAVSFKADALGPPAH